jgi:hypothetical protein
VFNWSFNVPLCFSSEIMPAGTHWESRVDFIPNHITSFEEQDVCPKNSSLQVIIVHVQIVHILPVNNPEQIADVFREYIASMLIQLSDANLVHEIVGTIPFLLILMVLYSFPKDFNVTRHPAYQMC